MKSRLEVERGLGFCDDSTKALFLKKHVTKSYIVTSKIVQNGVTSFMDDPFSLVELVQPVDSDDGHRPEHRRPRGSKWKQRGKFDFLRWPSLFDVFLSLVMLTSKKIYQNSEFVYFLYYLHFLVKFLHQIQIYWAAIQCRHTWNCLCCSFNFKQSSIISKLSSVMNSKLYLHSLLWSAIV